MSRTAALSRYLAAVDAPAPGDDGSLTTRSKQSSTEESSRTSKTQQQPPDLLTAHTMDDDVYSGRHKVVVAPSTLGMSVRDVVSSRNQLPDGRPRSRSAGRAPRSSRDLVQDIYNRVGVDYSNGSANRTPRETASTENTTRSHAPQRARNIDAPEDEQHQQQPTGAPSSSVNNADKFQERYRAAAALSTTTSPRGRNGEQGAPERRSRSLGRRWPPGRSVQTAGEPPSTKATHTAMDADPDQQQPASERRRGSTAPQQVPQNEISLPSFSSRNDAPGSASGRGRYGSASDSVTPSWRNRASSQSHTSQLIERQDTTGTEEKTDTSDSMERDEALDEMPPPGSVKSRLSAYSSSTKSKNSRNFRRPHPSHYVNKRDHPPKIDIYEEIRRTEEADSSIQEFDGTEIDSAPGPAPEPSMQPPSPVATAAADAAAEIMVHRTAASSKSAPAYGAKSQSPAPNISPTKSRRGGSRGSSGVAGAFLAAINNAPQPVSPVKTRNNQSAAPITEVATNPMDESAAVDSSSVLSALSGDEFAQSPRRDGAFPIKHRSTWSERNKLASYQRVSSQSNGNQYTPGTGNQHTQMNGKQASQANSSMITQADIEKMVNERVQAQVKEVEARMEEQMQKLETRLENQMKAGMEYMEQKIDTRMDEIQSMLSVMLNGNGASKRAPSSGFQEI